jgi:hypothetical protein
MTGDDLALACRPFRGLRAAGSDPGRGAAVGGYRRLGGGSCLDACPRFGAGLVRCGDRSLPPGRASRRRGARRGCARAARPSGTSCGLRARRRGGLPGPRSSGIRLSIGIATGRQLRCASARRCAAQRSQPPRAGVTSHGRSARRRGEWLRTAIADAALDFPDLSRNSVHRSHSRGSALRFTRGPWVKVAHAALTFVTVFKEFSSCSARLCGVQPSSL